jgi:WD40 repeat protein
LPVHHPSFSPDGRRVVRAYYRSIPIRDAVTGQTLGKPLALPRAVERAEFSTDGRRVLTLYTGAEGTARVWNAETGEPLIPPLRHGDRTDFAALSPDGRLLATTGEDKLVRLWDATTGKPAGDPLRHDGMARTAVFSPDGRRLATVSGDWVVRIWELSTGRLAFAPMRYVSNVRVVFSPDGRRLAVASYGDARVWDMDTGQALTPPLEHDRPDVTRAVFSPDGRRLATAGQDQAVRLWDADTGEPLCPPLRHPGEVSHLVFSPEGDRLLTVTDLDPRLTPSWTVSLHRDLPKRTKILRLWDATTGLLLAPPLPCEGLATVPAFSADGRHVLLVFFEKGVHQWDIVAEDLPGDDLTPRGTSASSGGGRATGRSRAYGWPAR